MTHSFFKSKIKILLWLVTIMTSIDTAFSQSLSTDDGIMNWEIDFRAGLNNDGYQADIGIAYFPIQYVGVKAQLGLGGEIKAWEYWGYDELDTFDYYATRFKFTSGIVLRTPRLIHWKSQSAGFYIFAEPGIILSPGAKGSERSKWFNQDLKCGINMQIDRFILTLGYGVSNFSLYSGYPYSYWGLPDKDNYITHSVFIGGAYKF